MIRIFIMTFIVCFIGTLGNVHAQDVPKAAVEQLARHAHGLLPDAKISSGAVIGAERAKTLTYPLVPYKIIEFVVIRGNIAGMAAHCGLDWQKQFYLPMMGFLRGREKTYTDYQWAYVGLLHGVSMGGAQQSLKGKPCDEAMKKTLLTEAK